MAPFLTQAPVTGRDARTVGFFIAIHAHNPAAGQCHADCPVTGGHAFVVIQGLAALCSANVRQCNIAALLRCARATPDGRPCPDDLVDNLREKRQLPATLHLSRTHRSQQEVVPNRHALNGMTESDAALRTSRQLCGSSLRRLWMIQVTIVRKRTNAPGNEVLRAEHACVGWSGASKN